MVIKVGCPIRSFITSIWGSRPSSSRDGLWVFNILCIMVQDQGRAVGTRGLSMDGDEGGPGGGVFYRTSILYRPPECISIQ